VQYGGKNVLIDTTPDFRAQALARGHRPRGYDPLHPRRTPIISWDSTTCAPLKLSPERCRFRRTAPKRRWISCAAFFHYAFDAEPSQSSTPRVDLHTITEEPFDLFGLRVIPIPLMHGRGGDPGIPLRRRGLPHRSQRHSGRLKSAFLRNLDVLFLDALRYRPHPTHSTVEQSLGVGSRARAAARFSLHISATICHMHRPKLGFHPTFDWPTTGFN